MLRRKLLIVLAILTALMLGTALSSVLLMRGVLQDLEQINKAALDEAAQARKNPVASASIAFDHIKAEQNRVTTKLRWVTIGVAAVFVLLINISIVILFRAAVLVLKPVDRLLEASRHLAHEDYSFRVDVGQSDEFDELAQAFNTLAAQLGANEQRKVETLHQMARTLNHELNNAIAVIELQLRMVTKSPGYDQSSSEQLHLIHETLHKMKETIQTLPKVRRVVLTEYTQGVQMLDLKLSTQPKEPGHPDCEVSSS